MINRTIPDNSVDPCSEGRRALKSRQVQEDVQPCVLHHIVSLDRRSKDRRGHPTQRRVMSVDQLAKGDMVALSSPCDQMYVRQRHD